MLRRRFRRPVYSRENISILERGPRVGKKLLVTGNGRCNLTNLELDFSRYHGAPESFVSAVFSQLPPKDTLSLFGRLGLLCREEGQGRCYPYGGQASAVLDVLRRYLEGRNVEERCQTSVETVKRKPGGYELKTSGGVVFAKRLILAFRRAGHALLRLRRKRPEAPPAWA